MRMWHLVFEGVVYWLRTGSLVCKLLWLLINLLLRLELGLGKVILGVLFLLLIGPLHGLPAYIRVLKSCLVAALEIRLVHRKLVVVLIDNCVCFVGKKMAKLTWLLRTRLGLGVCLRACCCCLHKHFKFFLCINVL